MLVSLPLSLSPSRPLSLSLLLPLCLLYSRTSTRMSGPPVISVAPTGISVLGQIDQLPKHINTDVITDTEIHQFLKKPHLSSFSVAWYLSPSTAPENFFWARCGASIFLETMIGDSARERTAVPWCNQPKSRSASTTSSRGAGHPSPTKRDSSRRNHALSMPRESSENNSLGMSGFSAQVVQDCQTTRGP